MLLIKTRVKTSNYLGEPTKNSLVLSSEFFVVVLSFFILNSIKVFKYNRKIKNIYYPKRMYIKNR